MHMPSFPKIYHIVHYDRLRSIINDQVIWCDAEAVRRFSQGIAIGMSNIKRRRLTELTLDCYPDLYVGECVPFYFCPRSVMLYLIAKRNHSELSYHGGQGPIVHLVADLHATIKWANQSCHRWAFTLSNAGAYYFEDRCDIRQLKEIDWTSVEARNWGGAGVDSKVREGKQAEFLLEKSFPWNLVTRIGVLNRQMYGQVRNTLSGALHKPAVEILPAWYY